MATIVLSAAGAAIGGALGGGIAGLPAVAIGRAVGAVAGQALDSTILGAGSDAVEVGRVERFRLTDVGEGAAVPNVFGRMRVGGQIIWASDFLESKSKTGGGGKGRPKPPKTTTYSYSVSLALALCAGEIASVGRVWADGEEVAPESLNMRVYTGSDEQMPDPTMEAIEGAGNVPAYRGTAYVVMDGVELGPYGNRVPQFSFEVLHAEEEGDALHHGIPAIAMMPGTGEYALSTEVVHLEDSPGRLRATNVNSASGQTDFETSVSNLRDEVPGCEAVSLVVSWFGDDLRCGHCQVQPRVEQKQADGREQPWHVAGVERSAATQIETENGRPIYGGTPSDASVIQAIQHMRDRGLRVMFYPFILMEQTEGNTLTDPWTGQSGQPALPWRGRITLSVAPGRDGTPDRTGAADGEVADFFGSASAADFRISGERVSYEGSEEWGLRRFILHYAALCKAAGGVDAFCISSEMRSLTQIRGADGFPAVDALRDLAAEVRHILGPDTKIGYAADWSEYFGYQPPEGDGAFLFHLDPLWADPNIDFVGIDNYMPISDWRDGDAHLDRQAGWKSIYDPAYLRSNIEGGEGFDWFYHSPAAADAQIRTPISDDVHGEDWIWKYKDLRSWWSQPHHNRPDGVRQAEHTEWVPGSKPIFFTELGCAAIDKGTNQPNKFLDPKSSESSLPRYSNGFRDDFMQMQYLKSVLGYWQSEDTNPRSDQYDGHMIDMSNAYVWAWDARPYPAFPRNVGVWSDGQNYLRGHWVNGRIGSNSLSSVVSRICRAAGLEHFDTSGLRGVVTGYVLENVTDARSALQPLMLRYGFDAVERDGVLRFVMRGDDKGIAIERGDLVETDQTDAIVEFTKAADVEISGRVRVRFVQAGGDHEVLAEEAVLPEDATHSVQTTELPLAMSRGEAHAVAERWLAEARIARDGARFGLPPSMMNIGAGDVVSLSEGAGTPALFRVDQAEQAAFQLLEGVRVEPELYQPTETILEPAEAKEFTPPSPVLPVFLDLPLLTGDEVPHAPHVVATADPWPGSVAVYASNTDENYALSQVIENRSTIGFTETSMARVRPGVWDRTDGLQVKLISGQLESRSESAVLNGANLAAIGDGTPGNWEVFQFADAELVDKNTYRLTNRLRGQLGTDAVMPPVWPENSMVVFLSGTDVQLELASAQRRMTRHYLIGPAQRPYDDPSFEYRIEAFDGNGLRPFSPCHIRVNTDATGDAVLHWIRRTRIEGDSWDLAEVPLGEDVEEYRIRVLSGGAVVREAVSSVPKWSYTLDQRDQDGALGPVWVEIAQVSARYGAGLARRVQLDAVG